MMMVIMIIITIVIMEQILGENFIERSSGHTTAFESSTHEITVGFFLDPDLNDTRTPFHLW